jgi:hypothetical protein
MVCCVPQQILRGAFNEDTQFHYSGTSTGVFFSTQVFGADAPAPAATPAAAAAAQATDVLTTEAVKAVTGETVIGTIKKIDTAAKTILVKDQTITVKQKHLKKLKVGYKVKVSLAAGTMNA